MNREIQRNLDLIKEIKHKNIDPIGKSKDLISHCIETELPSELLESFELSSLSYLDPFICPNKTNQETVPVSRTSLHVSF